MTLLQAADLVFVRDRISEEYVRELNIHSLRVQRAPDITITLPGVPPITPLPTPFACIVPNEKMLTHTNPATARAYLSFMTEAIEQTRRRELEPIILLHESADRGIATELQTRAGRSLHLVENDDALVLKGIIGAAQVVIGSRFHALVSALSQGVPSIATGWSHKYVGLFEDFGCPELVLSPHSSVDQLSSTIDRVLDQPERDRLAATLEQRTRAQVREVSAMWTEVRRVLTG